MAEAVMQCARKLQQAKRRRQRWAIAAGASLIVCMLSCFGRLCVWLPGPLFVLAGHSYVVVSVGGQPVQRGSTYEWSRDVSRPAWKPMCYTSYEPSRDNIWGPARKNYIVGIPISPLPLLCGMIAAWHHRRVRQLSTHMCPCCGYDTRGLAANVCPECGTVRSA
ncbi:MAG TPA: hypothetical protein VK157_16380 [Phycisphaerales bacterium]|nr:hypothetical protein [Phycisphaerales bacterium]